MREEKTKRKRGRHGVNLGKVVKVPAHAVGLGRILGVQNIRLLSQRFNFPKPQSLVGGQTSLSDGRSDTSHLTER